jgi:glycosyltransferase involved in cell wall biosynthesis
MLSICIPIYNFNVVPLIEALSAQIDQLALPCELICIDDASSNEYKETNKTACSKHRYIELNENIGRSRIRNLFLQHANFPYLLFLDCDALIIKKDFIQTYVQTIENENPAIICGGRIYDEEYPGKAKRLRWVYGHKKESQAAHIRKAAPNKSFMTNNFVVKKSILSSIKFDESLSQYGHEDTLFGYELKKHNILIHHIENPILNGDVEDNSLFIYKTEQGLENLAKIYNNFNAQEGFVREVTLLNTYHRLQKIHGVLVFAHFLLGRIFRVLLSKGIANMLIFNFYKLGYFARQIRK